MFTCIACSKPEDGEEEGGARGSGTPSTKEAVKSLTTQVPNPTPSLIHSLSLSIYIYFFNCLSIAIHRIAVFLRVQSLLFFSIFFPSW
jgi:hypothetical protein